MKKLQTSQVRAAAALVLVSASAAVVAADRHPAAPAAAVSAAAANTPRNVLSAAGEGRRLFLQLNCYSCHGMYAGGGMGPGIVRAELGDVSEALLQGEGGGMRSYRNYVTTTDIANIAAYLQSIGTASEPKFKDWWLPNPPK